MKHVSPYLEMPNHDRLGLYINESISGLEHVINRVLSPESFKEEAEFLNKVESMIPEDLQFQLHLNMIFDESKKSLSRYNRSISNGANSLIESASSFLSKDQMDTIKDAFERMSKSFRESRTSDPIFEQATLNMPTSSADIAGSMGDDFNDVMQNIESPDDIPSDLTNSEGGIWSLLKSLWNGLTEGGSPIGIFQFILDIVGLVGDFFGPVGLIADVINGLIYLYRGKYVLAGISFIAAMIPLGGNVLKGFLQTSKSAKPFMKAGELYLGGAGKAGAKVSDEAAQVIAAAAPESAKALEYISKTGKKAMSGLSGFIGKFFNGFLAKLVGWIPFIGKPLKAFFEGVANTIASFSSKMTKFADDIPQILKKADLINMNKFFKAAGKEGSEIVVKGGDLVVTSAKGKSFQIPAQFLKGTDFMVQRYGKGAGKELQKLLRKTEMNSLDFYKSLSDGLKFSSKAYGKPGWIKAGNRVLASIQFGKKVPLFIGKEVYKWITDAKSYLTDSEYEAWGNAAIHDMIQGRIDKALEENPDAVYDVPYLDSEDTEARDVLREYQQTQADLFNLPNIGVVGYYARGEKDKVPAEVNKFYQDLYQGDTKQLDAMNNMFKPFESDSSSMRYITPYSQFIS